MSYANLEYDLHEHVARIVINRPQAYNAIDLATARELCDIVNRIGADSGTRAVVITGAGTRAFCAGGDVASFARDPETVGPLLAELTGFLHRAISGLARMDAPVLAAVNGAAAGAGLSLAAACDLAIAADNATFTSAYTAVGLSPDGSSSYYLPRLLGWRRAMELYMTNRTLSADEAMAWGLVNKVVPQVDFGAEVERLAASLASGATRAFGAVKKLMMASPNETLESQMERERREIVVLCQSWDGREGARAFVEKRRPRFSGS